MGLAKIFKNDDCGGDQCRDCPPKTKTHFPDEARHTDAFSCPLEGTPDVGSGGNAEGPGHGAHDPKKAALGFALAHFLRAQLHAELRTCGESSGEGNGYCAQSAK